MSEIAEQKSQAGSARVQIILGILLLVGTLGGAYIQGCFSSKNATPAQSMSSIQYSGRVTADGDKPVAGAQVLAAIDQSVPQTFRTDVNGLFQIPLSGDAQSLKLFVSAPGYADVQVQANIHRIGSEEIYLHLNSSGQHQGTSKAGRLPTSNHPVPRETTPRNAELPAEQLFCRDLSTCVGGHDNTVTVQHLGPEPIAFNPDQLASVSAAIKPWRGTQIKVKCEMGTQAEQLAVESLVAALREGGAVVDFDPALTVVTRKMQRLTSGIIFEFSADRGDETIAIASALKRTNFIPPDGRFEGTLVPAPQIGILEIYVGHSK